MRYKNVHLYTKFICKVQAQKSWINMGEMLWGLAQLDKYLPSMHEAWALSWAPHSLCVVAHACNPRTWGNVDGAVQGYLLATKWTQS